MRHGIGAKMIPKIVHYCWLSDEEMPETMTRCMATWREKLPGWGFVRWDAAKASSLDAQWLRAAIARKQWAFASDYIRIWALYHDGGLYLDTDVEVLKDISPLLNRDLLVGEESGTGMVEAAVMGAAAGNSEIAKVLDSFEGSPTGETLPERLKRVMGSEMSLMNAEVLSPKNWKTGKVNVTANTYTVHHFAGSWLNVKEKWAARMGRLLGAWAIPCTRWLFHRFGK